LRFIQGVRDDYSISSPDQRIAALTGLSWKAWDLRRKGWSLMPRLWSRPLVP
jgi:hypothetical protein